MGWSALTLVTDADLGALEPEATNGAWRSTSWPNQRTEAKRDIKIWLETDYARIPNVADKVRDTYVADAVYAYTAGGYRDWTASAEDITEDDINLSTIFATPASDRLYIGSAGEFDGVSLRLLSGLNAATSALSVQYYGPSGWTDLSATDGTSLSGAAFAQSGRITWSVPTNWQRRVLNNSGNAYYWISIAVSATLTSGTATGQVLVIKAPDGLKRVAAFRALGYIYKNLAAQAPSTDYWAGRVSNQFKTGYWDLADALYAAMREKGGIPIDVDNNESVSPEESNLPNPIRIGRA